jgi:hypothetical protein
MTEEREKEKSSVNSGQYYWECCLFQRKKSKPDRGKTLAVCFRGRRANQIEGRHGLFNRPQVYKMVRCHRVDLVVLGGT